MTHYIKKIFTSTYTIAQTERSEDNASAFKTISTCVIIALSLTFIKYFGDSEYLYKTASLFGLKDQIEKLNYNDTRLFELLWWASVLFIFYFIVPALTIKFLYKEKLSSYGIKIKAAFNDKKIYFIMLLIMIPLVICISYTSAFQNKYPFYQVEKNESLLSNFLIWEIVYFLQFFALEFFFRGFMIHATKNTFGFYSIFVMTIPYCMIHFGKPMPETIVAIIAGIVLGTLSLKSKSIWMGVAIHYSVAITMDLASLWQKGIL